MTEQSLAIYKDFDGLQRAAIALQKSGYFSDVKSEAQAIVKVMAGQELGLAPFTSMSGIHIIQNKPVLGSNIMATLVKNDPRYDYHVKQCDDKACILEWLEDGHKVGEAGFTIQEAQAAGLTTKDNWKKYTSDMLFARAISRGARRFAPGIFGGAPVYTPDEMGVDTDEDGYIDAESVVIDELPDVQETIEEVAALQVDPIVEAVSEPMTLEKAYTVTNSEGELYHTLDDEKLTHMSYGIGRALHKSDITPEHKAELEMKFDVIRVILNARKNGEI